MGQSPDDRDDEAVGIPLVKAGGGRLRRKRVPEGGSVTVEINREAHSRRMKRYRVRARMRATGHSEDQILERLREMGLGVDE